jgi:predicted transcriptional regulator
MQGREPPASLSDLEGEVMDQIWRNDEATVRQVLEALNQGRRERAYTTVMTIMSRLQAKGMLRRRRRGRSDVYRPVLSREQYAQARARTEVDGLVANYGEVALAHFARQLDGLDPDRRRQLERLAREHEE